MNPMNDQRFFDLAMKSVAQQATATEQAELDGLLAARGLGLAEAAPAVASAQAKLARIMPPNLKARVRAVDETVALDLSRPTACADNAVLISLSSAAQARRRARIRYRDPQQRETDRDFDCYGLAWRGGFWYAVGRCHLRKDERTFRAFYHSRTQRASRH